MKIIFLRRSIGLLLVCSIFFTINVATARQFAAIESPPQIAAKDTAKSTLATNILTEIGIAARYDLHFDHLMGTLIGPRNDMKLFARFKKMFVREIGWKRFTAAYVARLTADFSEGELKELLKLSKQPVMQKLLNSEFKAYADTSAQRFKLGFELWDNYNSGNISLPN